MEHGVQRPILHRLEGADLTLPFDDQAHSDCLHAAGREAAAHLVPQQRRDLVADQAVEDAAGLLRVDQVLIDVAGMVECFLHGLLGDLVEGDAANFFSFFGVGAQLQRQMIGNRLTLAVRVGRQVNFVRLGGQLLELIDNFLLAGRHDQLRLKGPILQAPRQFRSSAGP